MKKYIPKNKPTHPFKWALEKSLKLRAAKRLGRLRAAMKNKA